MDNSTPEVDASRPFRSVKEAVSIFGDRLFLKQIPSPPKLPTIEVGNETPNGDRLFLKQIPSPPKLPTIEVGNETQSSPELPSIEVGNETQSSPELPTIEVGNETPHSSDKPRNPLGEQDVESSLGEQDAESSFDGHLCSSEIIPDPTESPTNKMTKIPKSHRKENSGNIVHGNDLVMMMMVLKKLEAELQETKAELKLLKEKGTETDLALASLNAELHKSMSKIAKTETDEAGKARTKSITVYDEAENKEMETKNEARTIRSELMVKTIDSPTLAQILSISDYEGYFMKNKSKTKKSMKKKPIVPLVTDLCLWKKKESPNHVVSEPIFSKMYFT